MPCFITLLTIFMTRHNSEISNKEKFKDIIFKEKVACYKKICESSWQLFSCKIDLINKTTDLSKFTETLRNFNNCVYENEIFISTEITKAILEFHAEYSKTDVSENEKQIYFNNLAFARAKLCKVISEELQLPVLNEEIIRSTTYGITH